MNHLPDYNIANLIVIAAAIQGFIFGAYVLLFYKHRTLSHRYLAALVLLISVNNLYYWVIDTNLYRVYQWRFYRYVLIPWDLLMLPVFYFFVATYLQHPIKKKILYLLPFITGASFHITFFISRVLLKNYSFIPMPFINEYYGLEEYATILFNIFMILITFRFIRRADKKLIQSRGRPLLYETKWLKQMLLTAFIICITWIVLLFVDHIVDPPWLGNRAKYYFIWICMSGLIYCLGYSGVYHLGIFNQRKKIRLAEKKQTGEKSTLKKEHFDRITSSILNEKMYLNPNLTLHSLSQSLQMSESYISAHINSFSQSNFSTFINHLRIEYAKKLLRDPAYTNFTIVSIALESGFNSKSTFYAAFKKHEGISPTVFRNS